MKNSEVLFEETKRDEDALKFFKDIKWSVIGWDLGGGSEAYNRLLKAKFFGSCDFSVVGDDENEGGFDLFSSSYAKPPGVELWVDFNVHHDQDNVILRDKAGISSLMDRPSIYRDKFSGQVLQPSWYLSSLFGSFRSYTAGNQNQANHAEESQIYTSSSLSCKQISKALNGDIINETILKSVSYERDVLFPFSLLLLNNRPVGRQGTVQLLIIILLLSDFFASILYEFSVEDYDESIPVDLELNWKLPVTWSSLLALLQAFDPRGRGSSSGGGNFMVSEFGIRRGSVEGR